jgi:hypothetical protein
MPARLKPDIDGLPHSRPGSVDQQMEDSFPASDAPSFPGATIGAPGGVSAPAIRKAEKRSGAAKKRKSR